MISSLEQCRRPGRDGPPPQTIFLLGVGAQKSGTTWLHSQLKAHPSVRFGWKKEIALWGTLWDRNLASRKPRRLSSRIRQRFFEFPSGKRVPHFPIFAKQLSTEYFAEFRKLCSPGVNVVGDITPHYAALSAENFRFLRSEIIRNGFEPRVLFGMRDPINRAISGVLHANRRLANPTTEELSDLVRQTYRSYPVRVRTQYDRTVLALEEAFLPHETFFYFFEELFSAGTLRDLANWLGLENLQGDFGRIVGGATHKVEVSEELKNEMRDFYNPTYEFVAQRFSPARVGAVWKNY